jgi:UDP-N-acetylmuramate dehydrogenase
MQRRLLANLSSDLTDRLLDRLRSIEGLDLVPDEPLSKHNTFRIGGPAELLGRARTLAALSRVVGEMRGAGAPLQVLGLGSNVLIPDEGLPGLVLRLDGDFKKIEFEQWGVWCGAAVPLGQLARRTAAQGRTGLEPLSGFPSTLGGAVVMNAGCYGAEIKDLLESTTVVEADGSVTTLTVDELEPGYRSSALQGTPRIVADARLRLGRGDAVEALEKIRGFNQKRQGTLPMGLPNVGSIFKNPEGDYAGRLIDECGLKGLEEGGARISPGHGNVIVNAGGARAADVLVLMMRAREAVAERFGVELEPEVVLTGDLGERWRS